MHPRRINKNVAWKITVSSGGLHFGYTNKTWFSVEFVLEAQIYNSPRKGEET
jgi:hypothetical protein